MAAVFGSAVMCTIALVVAILLPVPLASSSVVVGPTVQHAAVIRVSAVEVEPMVSRVDGSGSLRAVLPVVVRVVSAVPMAIPMRDVACALPAVVARVVVMIRMVVA